MTILKRYWSVFVLMTGCAGMERSCSGCSAEMGGADWVVIQADAYGRPFRCWPLRNVSIGNEEHSDGIWWQDSIVNLVHISGFYNRVQVQNGNWSEAYRSLGLTSETCQAVATEMYDVGTRTYRSVPAPSATPTASPIEVTP